MTAHANHPMPFVLEADAAAAVVERGIAARARVIRFPLGIAALSTIGRMAPDALVRRVFARILRDR
jgi:hypothetical protein